MKEASFISVYESKGIVYFSSLRSATEYAKKDKSISKISFQIEDDLIILNRDGDRWVLGK